MNIRNNISVSSFGQVKSGDLSSLKGKRSGVVVHDSFVRSSSRADLVDTGKLLSKVSSSRSKDSLYVSKEHQEVIDLLKHLPPWKKVKVFLVHGSHTGGHRSAAESIKKVLDKMPNVESEVINALDYTGGKAVKNAQIKATDFVMEKLAPVRAFAFEESFKGNPIVYWLGNTAMKIKAWMSKSFLNKIQREKPDIIISCHSPMNSMLSYWKGKGLIEAPLFSVVTDFRVHRMWSQPNVERYYVATEQAKKDLVNFGVSPDKIKVTGIPIKPQFAEPKEISKTELREKLGLDPKLPTVLMMGGSLGLGRFDEVAKALNELDTKVQLVCITGKNTAKKKALEELKKSLKIPVKVLGYVNNVSDWMDASDMIISKPGGLTTSEIFAKKIPMIILDPTPGLEEMLVDSIVATGGACNVKGPKEAAKLVEKWIKKPQEKGKVLKSLEKVGKPKSAYTVADDIVKTVLNPKVSS